MNTIELTIVKPYNETKLDEVWLEMKTNVLYYGDNLKILREYIPDNSIDLIYLDPPFNSNATYNILFKEPTGEPSQAQIAAFEDTWHWCNESEKALQEIIDSRIASPKTKDLMNLFIGFLGKNDMMAYLTMMCIRLIELRRVLKDSGTIYLHCDPTASHYLKIMMDAIFGLKYFRNEIIWHYRRWTAPSKKFQRLHDVILFYTKRDDYIFNQILIPYTDGSIERKLQGVLHRFKNGEEPFLVSDKNVQSEGVSANDVFQIPFIAPSAKERLGYPTQKPETLLERLISASSNEGDIILDPFCGCGTALVVAERLKRKWIGMDITHLAIGIMKWRLGQAFHDIEYDIIGEPEDLAGAVKLASDNKYQFQWWAVHKIGGQPYGDKKKGADTGIDGYKYFTDEVGKVKKAIISVKGGGTSVKDIRDLVGVLKRENVPMGIFVTLEKPTTPMIQEAAKEGIYKSPLETNHAKLQILTIEEIFNGKRPDLPPQLPPIKTKYKAKQQIGKMDKLL